MAESIPQTRGTPSSSLNAALLDADSREWLGSLQSEGLQRDAAVARLHALLLRAARFELARRRDSPPYLRGSELDEITYEAANDALVSVLAWVGEFRGASRFTTWVYKFALLEVAVRLRTRGWQDREVPLEPDSWSLFSSAALAPDEQAEQTELLGTLQAAITNMLTPHQRGVLVAANGARSTSSPTACR